MRKPEHYLDKLIGQANVTLTGASDAALRVQLYDTFEEFFDNSNCWKESIDLTVVPETGEYTLTPVSGRILRLNGVYDQNLVPQAAVMPTVGKLQFLYPYTNVQPMTVSVVKTVTDPMKCYPPHIPEWVLPTHGLGILHGLLGNMMLQPGQSYSNPTLANFHLVKFRDSMAHARVASMRANAIGTQAWAFPQAYRVGGQRGGVSTFNVNPVTLR